MPSSPRSKTSPTIRTRTVRPWSDRATDSPTRVPVVLRNRVGATASPGAANQRPETIVRVLSAVSPSYATTVAPPLSPATSSWVSAVRYTEAVPGSRAIASATAAGSAGFMGIGASPVPRPARRAAGPGCGR